MPDQKPQPSRTMLNILMGLLLVMLGAETWANWQYPDDLLVIFMKAGVCAVVALIIFELRRYGFKRDFDNLRKLFRRD